MKQSQVAEPGVLFLLVDAMAAKAKDLQLTDGLDIPLVIDPSSKDHSSRLVSHISNHTLEATFIDRADVRKLKDDFKFTSSQVIQCGIWTLYTLSGNESSLDFVCRQILFRARVSTSTRQGECVTEKTLKISPSPLVGTVSANEIPETGCAHKSSLLRPTFCSILKLPGPNSKGTGRFT